MKKIIAIVIAALMLMSASAMAELVVDQTEYIAVQSYSSAYCYFFAKVTNTGDAPVVVDGSFDMLDATDTAVATQDIYGSYPYTIAPGQTAFVSTYTSHSDSTPDAYPGVRYTIVPSEAYSEAPTNLTVANATVTMGDDGWGGTDCLITVTIANEGAETANQPAIGFGVLDQNGELIYTSGSTVYSVGLPAGSSIEYTFDVNDALVEAWIAAGVEPTTVEAVAYFE